MLTRRAMSWLRYGLNPYLLDPFTMMLVQGGVGDPAAQAALTPQTGFSPFDDYQVGGSGLAGQVGGAPSLPGRSSKDVHINQLAGDRDGYNADCGPASLAMSLRKVGLDIPGASNDQQRVAGARQLMVGGDTTRDGIGANGKRSDLEHNSFTSGEELIQGAVAAGAQATPLQALNGSHIPGIASELQKGNAVMVSGAGGFGPDGNITGNGGHFVAVTGMTQDGRFIVNDPTQNGPVAVTADQLQAFMMNPAMNPQGQVYQNGSAISISNPSAQSEPPILAGNLRATRGGPIAA
jgi:hypothetical protein